jgi:hypothetical protein
MSATGSLILDSSVRGILDTNTLYGTAENVSATGSSNLDGLLASSSALVTNPQIAEASLGAITSIASSDVTHFAQGATSLGVVSSNAELVVAKSMTAQALLESLSSEAFLGIVLDAVGESNLGGLSAAGTAQGGEPPAPPEPQYGSRGPYQRKVKPKLEPVYEPEIPVIVETKKPIKILILKPNTISSNFNASAQNRIDFSIAQDEADLLMIL